MGAWSVQISKKSESRTHFSLILGARVAAAINGDDENSEFEESKYSSDNDLNRIANSGPPNQSR